CDYQIREKICNVCNESCIKKRTLACWTNKKGDELFQEMVGPWQFGEYQMMPAYKNDQEELDKINKIQIDDLNQKKRIRDEEITYEQVLLNPKELMPTDYFNSSFGKSTSLKKLACALSIGKEICKKSIDREYFDEYSNQEVITKKELTYDTWKLEDLLNLAKKDDYLFDNIFTFNKSYNREKRIGLHRRFSKSSAYTHGYMIRFTGQYLNGRVFFSIVSLKNQKYYQPEDLNNFINSKFDIKFNKEANIVEAQKYMYDDNIENLYKKDNIVYMKHEVNINYVLGGVICDINYKDNSFWVYNLYWNKDLLDNILMPKNLKTINQKL
ncbi:7603_t:CDS:2, partial [Gigaspora margarita]